MLDVSYEWESTTSVEPQKMALAVDGVVLKLVE